MLKQPLIRIGVLGFMLLGSALAFYIISPLFVRATIGYEGWPTLGYMPTRTPRPATATSEPTQTETPQPLTSEFDVTLLEGDASVRLTEGEFYPVAHEGSGTAIVYQIDENDLVLILDEFEVEDGPDLHVYLTSEETIENTSGDDLADGFDLGELKGLDGDQSYDIPSTLDLSEYNSVVIWCVPYQVPFAAAPLQAP
ncbi:MAG TPA: DM13 domain-containing protein [Anaerolineales bacterium]|jgi:hypothetical protein|nr:DM13 domain-containing protein [Anaerolineales bacterium]